MNNRPDSSPGGDFAARILAWYEQHGRKDLPWQRAQPGNAGRPGAYPVWVSEVMLQQTQVQTVIPYFKRFMSKFPRVHDLATAPEDEVLHLWSGLGYYARARNLHAAAKHVVTKHGGKFPTDVDELVALPGIGRSTAGAILSLAQGLRAPILDGNVKRVLCRHQAVEGYPGTTGTLKALWASAEARTPAQRVGAYTQAIMDLGATVCVRKRPLCLACPVSDDCVARVEGRQHELPAPKPRRKVPQRTVTFLVVENARRELLLERRPPSGIWGGLWSFPEHPAPLDAAEAPAVCAERFGIAISQACALGTISHGFTHFKLEIHPLLCRVMDDQPDSGRMRDNDSLWYNVSTPSPVGLAAPVGVLVKRLGQRIN